MKCDELQQIENPIEWGLYYDKNEVDAAITELKEVYKDSVDVKVKIWERYKKAEDEPRKTQRALWLARAERAKTTQLLLKNAINHLESKYKHRFDNMRLQFHVWGVVKRKCLKKAEEFV